MTLLETQRLNKTFGGVHAVQNVNFKIDDGISLTHGAEFRHHVPDDGCDRRVVNLLDRPDLCLVHDSSRFKF